MVNTILFLYKFMFILVWNTVCSTGFISLSLVQFSTTPSFPERPERDSEESNQDLEWFPGKEQLSKLGLWFGKDFD